MRQLIAASFAAAVLATSAGTAVARDDGELEVRRQVTHERIDTRACGGGECGFVARLQGDSVRHNEWKAQMVGIDWRNPSRQRKAQASGIDWRNPYRQRKAQMVGIDWRNPYRQRTAWR